MPEPFGFVDLGVATSDEDFAAAAKLSGEKWEERTVFCGDENCALNDVSESCSVDRPSDTSRVACHRALLTACHLSHPKIARGLYNKL
jgi:hypothetical protein